MAKGYCGNCETKLKPITSENSVWIPNGYFCKICGSVYKKDKLGRFRFYY